MRSLLLILLLVPGCGARTGFSELPVTACADDPPTCIAPSRFCEAPRAVDAVCNAATKQYECPEGTKTYERVNESAVCLPFQSGLFERLSGSLVRVPLDGGRCLWIADEVQIAGRTLRNVGINADTSLPFGACPGRLVIYEQMVTADPSQIVQITGGYRFGGRTHVTYREFRADPTSPFGVAHVGSGIARYDGTRIVIPRDVRFATDLDLGDASLVRGAHAFVFGCPGPPEFLTERCIVSRIDASDAMELFTGANWVKSVRGSDGKRVFNAGPWVSSVTASGSLLRHVYAVGFGTDLQMHTASAPEGPWSEGRTIARCALPAGDTQAFCAGPVVHEELADPTRPGEMVVTYGVGTLRPGERAPADYWPRLQRIP